MHANMHDIAGRLRANETNAETKLWAALRNRQLEGRKFRRQVPVAAFVVDFYCSEERLAIEVDGPIHDFQQEADLLRQQGIEALGIRMLRFTNDELKQNFDLVLQTIAMSFAK
jgi:very-short-patch-repair endonuclease